MTRFTQLLISAAISGGLAVPAAAQYPYPYPQPQPYPYPQQSYPYPQQYPQQYPPQAYPYGGYPQNQSVVGQVIDQLLGNRYAGTERQAIHSCGFAAIQRAQAQYGGYANPYGGNPYSGYNQYPGYMRVVAITEVSRRSGGLRVRGLIDSGLYRNRIRAGGDLSFRCNVNYNGYVTSIRVDRNYNRY